MPQVTIYLKDDMLLVAKRAATSTEQNSLQAAMEEIDRIHGVEGREDFDFLLDPKTRYADLGEDTPREAF